MTKIFLFLSLSLFITLSLSTTTTNFDARTQWPNCIQTILDQGECGSCWAFSAAEVLADRQCITNQTGLVIASPEPILDCTKRGCSGNTASTAWEYLIHSGTTSCNSSCTSGCAPIDSASGKSNSCHQGKCDSGSKWPETWQASGYQQLTKGDVGGYMSAIEKNGPIQAWFQIYDSFNSFFKEQPTGIYSQSDVSGKYQGNHYIKILGFGTEGGVDYWLCANSWGSGFGDNGYFKMQRGVNLCGIETYVYEGFPKGQSHRNVLVDPIRSVNNKEENLSSSSSSPISGHWVKQDDFSSDFVREVTSVAVSFLNSKEEGGELVLKGVVSVETQVVAGLNVKLELELVGRKVGVTLFRDLAMGYHLRDFRVVF